MPRYRFTQTYQSSYGDGKEGDEIDCPESAADDINRDAPGTLVPVRAKAEPKADEDAAETHSLDAPPADRMQRTSKKRSA